MTFAQLIEDADNVLAAIQQFEKTAGVVTGLIPGVGPAVTLATDATTAAKVTVDAVMSGIKFNPAHLSQTQAPTPS